jgi:hypothetical protein
MKSTVLVMILLATAMPARAADWVIGLGSTDFSSDEAVDSSVTVAELHGKPFGTIGRMTFAPAVAVVVHTRGDWWLGGGVHSELPLGQGQWFTEASVMPGFYQAAFQGNDLGSSFEIRSLIGLGYAFAGGYDLSVAFEHKSNAGTSSRNPGANAFTLRLGHKF